jgi:hypothetical protein
MLTLPPHEAREFLRAVARVGEDELLRLIAPKQCVAEVPIADRRALLEALRALPDKESPG